VHFSMCLHLNNSSEHEEKRSNFWREEESAMATALYAAEDHQHGVNTTDAE
jgi:hypothetical protein